MNRKNLIPSVWRSQGWDPFREVSRLQRDVDRIFDDFFSPFRRSSSEDSLNETMFTPACDIEETDSHYLISFDLPGISQDDLRIEVKNNQLWVSGERKEERSNRDKNKMNSEKIYGSFERSFRLPSGIDPDHVQATFENGVLNLKIQKAESSKPVRIPIREDTSYSNHKRIELEKNEKVPQVDKKSA